MNHTIKLKVSNDFDKENLYQALETLFIQNNYKIDQKDDALVFERMTAKRGRGKLQIINELFEGFTKGTISVDPISQNELICRIN